MTKDRQYYSATIGADTVVRLVRRPRSADPLDGFLVGASSELAMLHVLDDHSMTLNGYAVVRCRDIRWWRPDTSFMSRALRILGQTPVAPEGVELEDWPSLLRWAAARHPLLGIEDEFRAPGCLRIGTIRKLGRRVLTLDTVGPDAAPGRKLRYPYSDITCVSFGDGYSAALAKLVAHEAADKTFVR
jgi:hypothetical protein